MRNRSFFAIAKPSVTDVDFKTLRKQGISCVLFDVEGTLTQWGDERVSAALRRHIASSGLRKIGIISNMPKSHVARAQKVGAQIGAKVVMVPQTWRMRKPGSAMVQACLQALSAEPSQTIIIGDKLIDALTAKRAGLAGVIWVEVLPGADHWFDKYIYRMIEPVAKKHFTKRYTYPS